LLFIFSPPFFDWVSFTFPLPPAGKENRQGNGKETAANGKDFGQEASATVRI
jgi:hypothetical protein